MHSFVYATLLAGKLLALPPAATEDEVLIRSIKARLQGTTAKFELSIELPHAESGSQSGILVALPRHGVAVSGAVAARGARHSLRLSKVTDADAVLEKLRESPATSDRGTAVEVVATYGAVAVNVVGAGGRPLFLSLAVESPTCFLGDARYVAIPQPWLRHFPSAKIVSNKATAARLELLCAPDDEAGDLRWLAFLDPSLSRRKTLSDRVGIDAARFAGEFIQVARVEVALPTRFGNVPDDLSTVFVLDASRSIEDDAFARQFALLRSYLRRAPNSAVQVIAFARVATPLLPGWQSARELEPRLTSMAREVTRRNGSNVDAALGAAGQWLVSRGGTRRVVLVTDELVAERLAEADQEEWLRDVPAGTLVHVVALSRGAHPLLREDRGGFAALATATLGIRATLGDNADPDSIEADRLVRPVSLDHVRLRAPGFTAAAIGGSACLGLGTKGVHLQEGESCTWWGQGPAARNELTLEGMLWGSRWQHTFSLGDRKAARVARELATSSMATASNQLSTAAGELARSVNAHWALVARWGGQGGYADAMSGGHAGAGGGCECKTTSGIGGFGTTGAATVIRRAGLAEQLRPWLAQCALGTVTATLTLETTRSEIVAVTVSLSSTNSTHSPAALAAMRTCLEEALWAATPALTTTADHATWRLSYP